MVGPPSSTNFVDGEKNPSQQGGSLPVPQIPIRLMNVWYGRPDGVMDPLPFYIRYESFKLNQIKEYSLDFSTLKVLESDSNLI